MSWIKDFIKFSKKNNVDYQDIFTQIGQIVEKNMSGGSLRKRKYNKKCNGGSLQSKDLKKLLSSTYDKKNVDIGDFKVDKSLSGKRAKVYHNQITGQTVTAHRGTKGLKDWVTDLGMALGYENGNRFKHAKKVQQKAEKKYGTENMTTIGHSLAGRLAEKYGQNGKEVITLNKAVTPRTMFSNVSNKQFDIRSTSDPVSALQFGQRNRNLSEIKTKTKSPLLEHNTNILNRRVDKTFGIIDDNNDIRGEGFKRKKRC